MNQNRNVNFVELLQWNKKREIKKEGKMKRYDISWQEVLIWVALGWFITLITGCQTQEPEFSVLGKWRGTNWYCNQCKGSNPIDAAATIQFEILTMDQEGGLAVTKANRIVPSCPDKTPGPGNCIALPWYMVEGSFVDNILRIEWTTGHVFIGRLQGNEFVGRIDYIIPEFSYLFNDDITITRR